MRFYNGKTDNKTDELLHYGVVGMRWGHRKAQRYSGYAGSKMSIAAAQAKQNTAKSNYKKTKRNINTAFDSKFIKATKKYYSDLNKAKTVGKNMSKERREAIGQVYGQYRKEIKSAKQRNANRLSSAKQAYKTSKKDVKAAKARNTMKLYEDSYGKNTVKRVTSASKGKTALQTLAFGSYGALKYNEARGRKGYGRGKAAVTGALNRSRSASSIARKTSKETRRRKYR